MLPLEVAIAIHAPRRQADACLPWAGVKEHMLRTAIGSFQAGRADIPSRAG